MLRRHKMSGIVLIAALVGTITLSVGLFAPHKAAAYCGAANYSTGYFKGGTDVTCGDGTFDDCQGPGAAPAGCSEPYSFINAPKGGFNKGDFITDVLNSPAKAFYINVMSGGQCGGRTTNPSGAMISCWEGLVNNPSVGMKVVDWSTGTNSFYDSYLDDYVFFSDPTAFQSIVFYSGGTTYTVVKIACGNIMGATALPKLSSPPKGSLALGCNANGTAYAVINFHDADGATTATLNVNFAGSSPPNANYNFGTADSNGVDHTYQIPVPNTNFAGAWGATLDIRGVNGSSNTSYTATHGTCDKTPTGTVSISCNADGTGLVKLSFSDGNGSTSAKLTVNYGGGVTPPTGVFDYSTSGSYSHTVPASDLEGAWSASMLVQDYGGPNDVTVKPTNPTIAPACAHPPTGSVQAAGAGSCDAVRVILDDVSYTGNLSYYLAVAGNTKGPKLTAPKNTLTPPTNQPGTLVNGYAGFNYWKQNTVDLYAVDPLTQKVSGVLDAITLPVCGAVSCGTAQIPANLVVGTQTPFTVSMTISGPPGIDGPAGAQFAPITIGGQTTTSAYTPQPPTATMLLTSTQQTYDPQTAGTYMLSWTFGGGADNITPKTCTKTVTAEYEPYFTVLGGDVSAGQGFGSSSTPVNADIAGEDLAAASGYFGASARQGAIATGAISQFATDTTNNVPTNLGGSTAGLTSIQPSGLAFANTSPPITAGSYGGQFLNGSSSSWFVPDYATSVVGSDGTAQPNYATLVARTRPYVYRIANDQTIGNIQLKPGVRVTLIVTGNVYINGNISYANYGGNPLGEPSSNILANVPQFSVIADGGNISVNSGVTELHGQYVAQPSSASANNGTIYTCATGSNQPSLAYNTCGQSLTFYGSVAAKMITLDRTYANLSKTASISDAPAEQFVFTPELWLGGISGSSTSCATDPTQVNCMYQSYTSLPPVL